MSTCCLTMGQQVRSNWYITEITAPLAGPNIAQIILFYIVLLHTFLFKCFFFTICADNLFFLEHNPAV